MRKEDEVYDLFLEEDQKEDMRFLICEVKYNGEVMSREQHLEIMKPPICINESIEELSSNPIKTKVNFDQSEANDSNDIRIKLR